MSSPRASGASFVLFLAAVASAASAVPMSLAERTRLSNRVVLAQVVSTQTVVSDGNPRSMRTLTKVLVAEQWKGEGPAQLEVEQLGGRWGLWESHVPGDAQFTAGETVVLWLRCPAQGACRLVRMGEGKARVEGSDVEMVDLVTGQRIRTPLRELRARVGISRSMISAEAPGGQDARGEHTRWYVTDEQRSPPGWIGAEGDRLIPSRALKARVVNKSPGAKR